MNIFGKTLIMALLCFASVHASAPSNPTAQIAALPRHVFGIPSPRTIIKPGTMAVSGRIVWDSDFSAAYNAKSIPPYNPKALLYDAQKNCICSIFINKWTPQLKNKSLDSIKSAFSPEIDTTKLTSITDYTDGSWKSFFGFKKITK